MQRFRRNSWEFRGARILNGLPTGSRRITGVRNFQAGAGIAVLRPLTHIHDPSATSFLPVQLTR
jgi:hypothetical protein